MGNSEVDVFNFVVKPFSMFHVLGFNRGGLKDGLVEIGAFSCGEGHLGSHEEGEVQKPCRNNSQEVVGKNQSK